MRKYFFVFNIFLISITATQFCFAQSEADLKKAQKDFEKKLKGRGHHLDYVYHLLLNDLEHSKELAQALHDHHEDTHEFDFKKRASSLIFEKSNSIDIEHGVTLDVFLAKFNNDELDEHYSLAISVYEVERKTLEKMSLAGYWKADEVLERLALANEYYFKKYIKKTLDINMSEIVFQMKKDFLVLDDANINKGALSDDEKEELTKDWSWWDKKIHSNINFFESISIYTLGKGHTKILLNNNESIEVTPENLFKDN